jgi:hypothetical protein
MVLIFYMNGGQSLQQGIIQAKSTMVKIKYRWGQGIISNFLPVPTKEPLTTIMVTTTPKVVEEI